MAGLFVTFEHTAASASQPIDVLQHQTAIDQAKRQFADAAQMVVARLQGLYGDEGYFIRQKLDAMDRALAAWDLAVQAFEAAVAQSNDPGLRLALARVYFDRHRSQDAVRECQTVIGMDPSRADVHALLGLIHLSESRLEQAAAAFEKAAALIPADSRNFYRLADIYTALGRGVDASAALETFRRSAETRLSRVLQDRHSEAAASSISSGYPDGITFLIRQAPVDLLAELGANPDRFLPESYESAASHFAQGNYSQAAVALRQAAEADPLVSGVPDLRGSLDEHVKAARAAVKRRGASGADHLRLGEILLAMDQPQEAALTFEKALERDPTLSAARLRLASLALRQNQFDVAIRHLTVLKQRPNSIEPLRLLGNAYWAKGDIDKAAAQYRAALAVRPADERVHLSLASALLSANRLEEGEAALKAALAAMPRSGRSWYSLGRLSQTRGRLSGAVDHYREALQHRPIAGLHAFQGILASLQADRAALDEAVQSLRHLMRLNPNSVPRRLQLGGLLLQKNRFDEALAEYLGVALMDPLNTAAHAGMAQVEFRRGRHAQAVVAARRALDADRDHMQARYTLGQALMRLGNVEEGRKELEEYRRRQDIANANEHRNRETVALRQEAALHFNNGDYDKAIEFLRKFSETRSDGQPRAWLGEVLLKAGRYDEAIESFKQAIELNWISAGVHLQLAEAYKALGRVKESERERAIAESMRAPSLKSGKQQ